VSRPIPSGPEIPRPTNQSITKFQILAILSFVLFTKIYHVIFLDGKAFA